MSCKSMFGTTGDLTINTLSFLDIGCVNFSAVNASITNLDVGTMNISNVNISNISTDLITATDINVSQINFSNASGDNLDLTADLNVSGNASITGNLDIGGDLTIDGDLDLDNISCLNIDVSVVANCSTLQSTDSGGSGWELTGNEWKYNGVGATTDALITAQSGADLTIGSISILNTWDSIRSTYDNNVCWSQGSSGIALTDVMILNVSGDLTLPYDATDTYTSTINCCFINASVIAGTYTNASVINFSVEDTLTIGILASADYGALNVIGTTTLTGDGAGAEGGLLVEDGNVSFIVGTNTFNISCDNTAETAVSIYSDNIMLGGLTTGGANTITFSDGSGGTKETHLVAETNTQDKLQIGFGGAGARNWGFINNQVNIWWGVTQGNTATDGGVGATSYPTNAIMYVNNNYDMVLEGSGTFTHNNITQKGNTAIFNGDFPSWPASWSAGWSSEFRSTITWRSTDTNTAFNTSGITGSGNWYGTCDRKLKENILMVSDAETLNNIASLNLYKFNFKKKYYEAQIKHQRDAKCFEYAKHLEDKRDCEKCGKVKRYGLMADEVKVKYPHLVSRHKNPDVVDDGSDGFDEIGMEGLIPFLVSSIKELKKQNDALQVRVSALEQLT